MDGSSMKKDSLKRRALVREALFRFQKDLSKVYSGRGPQVLVYGSYARRQDTEASDVDLLLLYPNKIRPGEEIRRLSPLLSDLNLQYQVLFSVMPIDESGYRYAEGPFWENIHREGIPIDAI